MSEATSELETTDVLAVNTKEACRLLGGISRRQLYTWIAADEIKTSKLPSSTGRPNVHLIEVAELREFLARHRHTSP